MAANMISWSRYPVEIRLMILEALIRDGCSLASSAAVSREWQTIIERHNFSRIKLTLLRLVNFDSMIRRNRSLVRYIWFCLELQRYNCTECDPQPLEGMSDADNALITTAFLHLFSTLSTWESDGNLLLDISVHSPSDSDHWFKYLIFVPDIPSDACDQYQHMEESMLVKVTASDYDHGYSTGSRYAIAPLAATHKVFDEIMGEGPFDNEEQEGQWWQQLPLVPAITSVLLRQQTRRRWKPAALAHMFARLPRLQEVHYEPWREWFETQQQRTDQGKCHRVDRYRLLLFSICTTGC